MYFIKKLDSLFLVRVHWPEGEGSARLFASPSRIEKALQQRLFIREKEKTDRRLRERQNLQEPAEIVIVLLS